MGGIRRERVRPHRFAGLDIDGGDRSTAARHQHEAEIGADGHASSGGRLLQIEYPYDLARLRVERGHLAVQRRHEYPIVRHRDPCLVRRAWKPGHPRTTERFDIARRNLRQRRVPLVRSGPSVERPIAPRPHWRARRSPAARSSGVGAARSRGHRRFRSCGRTRSAGRAHVDRVGRRCRQGPGPGGGAIRLQDVGGDIDMCLVAKHAGAGGRHGSDRVEQLARRPLAPALRERAAGQWRRRGPA